MPGAGPDVPGASGAPATAELAEIAREAGLRRVAILAWRDIDDAEAGGSELHAHEVATRWAAAGIDVVLRTSSVAGRAVLVERGGLPGRPPLRSLRRVRDRADGSRERVVSVHWTGWSRSGTGCRG